MEIIKLFLIILTSLPFVLLSSTHVESSHFHSQSEEEEDDDVDMIQTRRDQSSKKCDLSNGTWVYDVTYPLYDSNSCPYLSKTVSCRRNGRPDSDYEKWRWQPNGCSIQRFDALRFLGKMRRKRIMLVGDSISRSQWESLVCLVQGVIPSGRRVVTYNGPTMSFHALDYEMSIEFCWAPLLVEISKGPEKNRALHLDMIEGNAKYWRGADVLVFDSAQWWTHSERVWDNVTIGNNIYNHMNPMIAYHQALTTWSKWIDSSLNPNQTKVIFRTVSPKHNNQNGWKCYNQRFPLAVVIKLPQETKQLEIVKRVLKNMRFPVSLLDVTMLSAYRRDGHPSVYQRRRFEEKKVRRGFVLDCGHWCLPGVPDIWNEMLNVMI